MDRLNLYLVFRSCHYLNYGPDYGDSNFGYCQFESFVVASNSEHEARRIHPVDSDAPYNEELKAWEYQKLEGDKVGDKIYYLGKDKWTLKGWIHGDQIDLLRVTHIGVANASIQFGSILNIQVFNFTYSKQPRSSFCG